MKIAEATRYEEELEAAAEPARNTLPCMPEPNGPKRSSCRRRQYAATLSPMSATSLMRSSPGQVSTRVRMHLDVGGERLAVNQLGPDFALVESTANHLPGPANLSVMVDEALTVRPVFLPEGPPTLKTKTHRFALVRCRSDVFPIKWILQNPLFGTLRYSRVNMCVFF
jgi:hypothetical protein